MDEEGKLWKGPTNPDENLHYSKFHGFMKDEPFDEIWVLERTDQPEISIEMPEDDVLLYIREMRNIHQVCANILRK